MSAPVSDGGNGDEYLDPRAADAAAVDGPSVDDGSVADGPAGRPDDGNGSAGHGVTGEPRPPSWRLAAAALITIAALVGLLVSSWHGGFAFAYMGVVTGMIAMFVSLRATLLSAAGTSVAVFVGVLVSGSVTLSVLWMAVLACVIAWSSRYGGAVIASLIAAQAAIVIVSGHVFALAPAPFDRPHTAAGALPVTGFVLGGALVVVIVTAIFLHGYGHPATPRLTTTDAWWLLATVLPLTVVGTWVCRFYFDGTHAWWLLLTVFVVLLPLPREATARMHDRVLGTVAGAVVVMLITLIGQQTTVFQVLTFVAAVGTIATTSRSYTLNSAFLTATVLFMATPAATNPLLLHSERMGLTVLGALVAYLLMLGNLRLRRNLESRAAARRAG